MAYTRNIPASTDLISNSQSQIQANFEAIDSGTTGTGAGFSRNHVTLTDGTNGGLHNRVDYYQNVSDPSISGFVSSSYPKAGTADNTASQLFYRNSDAIYHLSPVKAWAFCNGTAGGITSSQSSNVTSVTRTGTGAYSVVLPANVVGSANYAVLGTTSTVAANGHSAAISYTISSATAFTLKTVDVTTGLAADCTSLSFTVIQI